MIIRRLSRRGIVIPRCNSNSNNASSPASLQSRSRSLAASSSATTRRRCRPVAAFRLLTLTQTQTDGSCSRQQLQQLRRYSRSHLHTAQQRWSVDSDTGIVSLNGTPKFQTVIGLEIHAQLDISTKLFSGCPVPHSCSGSGSGSSRHSKPNSSVWPMDVGVPGILPRLSAEAVRAAVLSAGAMNCVLPPVSRFERKHYFYADLPLGYQITQQRWPLARDGTLVCRYSHPQQTNSKKKKKKKKKNKPINSVNNTDTDDDDSFTLRIERVQLEQDTGKTLADAYTNPKTKQKESLVDFNRAGRALIEVVSHPDLRSATQASIAVETLRSLFKHIGTCDGKLEEGSLRCDLNVSIAPVSEGNDGISDVDADADILSRTGHRVEVKNLNSIRQVQQAAEYEALRQSRAIAEENAPTQQETRTFDVKSNTTVVLRTKEGAKDYRFLPEPDLPPLVLADALGGAGGGGGGEGAVDLKTFLETNLPELPDDARRRLREDHGLSEYSAGVITNDPPSIEFFDAAVREATIQLLEGETIDSNNSSSNNTNSNSNNQRAKRRIPETVANLLCNELFALVREFEMQRLIEEGWIDAAGGGGDSSVRFSRVTAAQLGEVVAMVLEGRISNTMAKQLLRVLYSDAVEAEEDTESSPPPPPSPRAVAKMRGFELVTDAGQLEALCRAAIESSPDELERYKLGGKYATKITKFLVGKAMAASRGNAHPERLGEVLVGVLDEVAPLEPNK